MNAPLEPAEAGPPGDRTSALFASLVMQNANMALLFLGRMPHPETGKTEVNLDAASMFIDTLEMLEAKTRGNLDADEANLLKETLTTLRFSFVQAAEQSPAPATPEPASPAAAEPTPPPAVESKPESADDRKKFVKRY